jgi:hypothetical protein
VKKLKGEAAQSLIEFALVIPVVLILFFGFLDLGRAVFYYSSLSNSVREATRYAIVHYDDLKEVYDERSIDPSDPQDNVLQDKVLEYSFGMTTTPHPLLKTDVFVYVTEEDGDFTKVQINATYCFDPVTPGIRQLFSSDVCKGRLGIPVEAQSTMRVSPAAR